MQKQDVIVNPYVIKQSVVEPGRTHAPRTMLAHDYKLELTTQPVVQVGNMSFLGKPQLLADDKTRHASFNVQTDRDGSGLAALVLSGPQAYNFALTSYNPIAD